MRVLFLCLHELKRSMRSLFLVGLGLGAPLAITAILYLALGPALSGERGGAEPIEVVLTSARGEGVLEQALSGPGFAELLAVRRVADAATAEQEVREERAAVAVVVDETGGVHVLSDPTLTTAPAVVESLVRQLRDAERGGATLVTFVVERLPDPGLAPQVAPEVGQAYGAMIQARSSRAASLWPGLAVESPAGEESSSQGGFMKSLIALILGGQLVFFTFFGGGFAAQSLLRDEEEGTLGRLRTLPLSAATLLGGKGLFISVLVLVQAAVLIGGGALLFGIEWGRPAAVALSVVGLVPACAGLGLFLMSFVKTSKQAGHVLGGAYTGLGFLGGLFTAGLPGLPEAFSLLNLLTPQGWAFRTFQLTLKGAPLVEVFTSSAVTLGIGLALFVGGVVRFSRRLA